MKKTLLPVQIFHLVLISICTSAALSEEKTKPDFSEAIRMIDTWLGKLAVFELPSGNPANDLTLLKHIEGDSFRRLRKDETLGEEVLFERDKTGKVFRMWRLSNYQNKIR